MKRRARATLLVALLAAFAAPTYAHDRHDRELSCDLHSEYSLSFGPEALRFERDNGQRRIELRQGALLVDGRAVTLTPADREKLLKFEQEVRAMMPEVRAIALEALEIAYTAVAHVLRAFDDNGSAERSIARLEAEHKAARDKIERGLGTPLFDEREFEKMIESTVATVVPEVVGNVTAAALKAAFSGDEGAVEAIERKAERLEKEIERDVERRADELGRRADKLCPQLTELDRLESTLDVRLADGRPLNLLDTKH
jgi:hypothetical protein